MLVLDPYLAFWTDLILSTIFYLILALIYHASLKAQGIDRKTIQVAKTMRTILIGLTILKWFMFYPILTQ